MNAVRRLCVFHVRLLPQGRGDSLRILAGVDANDIEIRV